MADRLLTCEEIDEGKRIVESSPDCLLTPLLKDVHLLGMQVGGASDGDGRKVHLKLENMQTTGSFKIRGVTSQMTHLNKQENNDKEKKRKVVTMSAGNYGKAFAFACRKHQLDGTVAMPTTAPESREKIIKEFGCNVVRVPSHDLLKKVEELQAEGSTFLHPFDDINIIAGYASVGMEMVEQLGRKPDVVVVCCGGGGFLAGVSAGLRRIGCTDTKIYGVEPETANSMQRSKQQNSACQMPKAHSFAAGLAPPFAGTICYNHVRAYVEDIVVVDEGQIASATRHLCERGLFVEPSGAAAFAAVMFDKVAHIGGDVVIIITGGNVSPSELAHVFEKASS